jgi:hypothetical protein
MWFTPDGPRKLTGAERRFAIDGATKLIEEIQDQEEDHTFHTELLNSIPIQDRRYLVMRVLKDLIGDGPAPKVSAWNQAIVWEMYQRMQEDIAIHTDYQQEDGPKREHFYSRRLALDAWKEIYQDLEDEDDDDELKPPALRSIHMEPWEVLVDGLFENVMEDSDFMHYEEFADLPPDRVEYVKTVAGIDPEFFSEAPAPVTQKETSGFIDSWNKLIDEENVWFKKFMKTGKIA